MEKKAHIDKLTADAVELLKEMIAIPSPSFREDEVCSHISGWMDRKGIAHRRVGNNIIAERIGDTSKPTLMICAHIDTVSPCEGYGFDPYKPDYQMAAKSFQRVQAMMSDRKTLLPVWEATMTVRLL